MTSARPQAIGHRATRLSSTDAQRYVVVRESMLRQEPWAFCASPADDDYLRVGRVAEALGDPHQAIFAIEEPSGEEEPRVSPLVAVASIRRMTGKFAHRARLWGVYVEPAFRGRGYGRDVVARALQHVRAWAGVDWVDLAVSANAPEALRLYERLGFVAWGREPESLAHQGRRYDEIYMCLRLREAPAPTRLSSEEQ